MREAYARAEQGELSRLILSFQGVNMIDSSAIHALHEMVDELRSQVYPKPQTLSVVIILHEMVDELRSKFIMRLDSTQSCTDAFTIKSQTLDPKSQILNPEPQGCMTVSIAAARRVVRSRIIRELQPKGFVSPAAEPTVLVNGFSTSNIREAFMAHPQTVRDPSSSSWCGRWAIGPRASVTQGCVKGSMLESL